jgi:flagellar hook-associated protein 2
VVDNPNTYREIAIRDVRVFDATSRGDSRPLNPLSQAADAALIVDGVTVTRDTNTIADLLPGVTLTLRGTSSAPVGLSVLPNTTLIKDKIIAFVGRYNQALTDIDVLTRRDETVVDQAYYATDAEREKATKRLGLLAGDMTLSRLKSQLTTTMMNAYVTSAGQEMALLAQIGIATNTQAAIGGVDRNRLRGYLDIDEPKLQAAVRDRTKAVQQLFGTDSDGDLVVDAGVGFEIDRTLRSYVGRAGIIAQRTGTIDTEITQKNRQIDRENVRLADTEAELKQKYATMEGALQSLEQSSKRLDSFNKTGQ